MKDTRRVGGGMHDALLCIAMTGVLSSFTCAQETPVFEILRIASDVRFNINHRDSHKIKGDFLRWDASLTFASPDVTTGVVDIKIQADSVSTGDEKKDRLLKGKKGFDAEQNPLITFRSTKIVQTGPDSFDVPGTLTLNGISKPEKLKLTISGHGTGSGLVKGTMDFRRRDFGMKKSSDMPLLRIGDTVELTVVLAGKRVSGPPLQIDKPSEQ